MEGLPAPGDVLLVTRAASVQFGTPVTFRVIRVVTEWVTYDRWIWLHGYQLDERGAAVATRDIFVQPAGLRLLHRAAPAPRRQPNQRPVRPKTPTTPQPRAGRQPTRQPPAAPPHPRDAGTPVARPPDQGRLADDRRTGRGQAPAAATAGGVRQIGRPPASRMASRSATVGACRCSRATLTVSSPTTASRAWTLTA
jgi:hypothetical protein